MVKLVPYFYEHDLCYLPGTMRNLLLTVHVSIVISEWLWNKSTNQTIIYFGYTLYNPGDFYLFILLGYKLYKP